MNYYRNIEEIPVNNFYNLFYEKDIKHLLIESKKKITQEEEKELSKASRIILHEYCYYSGDSSLFFNLKKEVKKSFLNTKINIISNCLKLYNSTQDLSFLELLKEIDLKFDKEKNLNEEIEKIIKKAKGLKNQYNLLNLKKKDNKKTQQKPNLTRIALNLEIGLKLGYSIDINKCSMLKWIEMNNLIQKK